MLLIIACKYRNQDKYTKRKQVSEILNKKSQINSKQETPNKSQMYKFQSANLLVSDKILDLGFIWSFLFRIYLVPQVRDCFGFCSRFSIYKISFKNFTSH